jgi:sugar transferase (PEP-CTERM/EpsH1 system associated)
LVVFAAFPTFAAERNTIRTKKVEMRIFVLLSRIPWPLEKGDKLRAFNQVKQLSEGNEIILCALNSDSKADKQSAFKALQPYCRSVNFIDLPRITIGWNVLKAWVSGRPLQSGYFYSSAAQKRVNSLIQEYKPDLIYGQLLRVAEYIRYQKLPKVIDYQDVFSMGMKRRYEIAGFLTKPFFYTEYQRLKRYEHQIFDAVDIKTIISLPDREHIDHPKRDEILIIPNGVDHDFFHPFEIPKTHDIVFTGNMAYPPNVNAAKFLVHDIMPLVWARIPDAKLLIAGATPDKSVKDLASEKVSVSGWLDDIRNSYAGSHIFIAPMRIGTGLQNKLLEAMSMKIPCITTSLANSALKGIPGEHLLVGDDKVELAQHIIQLLTEQETADRIAQSGYDFVMQYYDWKGATSQLIEAMKQLCKAVSK